MTTRDEAIDRIIIAAIESTGAASRDEYDIDAIADRVLSWAPESGYTQSEDVDSETFWLIVEAHALTD